MNATRKHLRASAPTRIDLAGGTLDLWPIHHLLEKKATVNFGIDLRASAELILRDDQKISISSIDQKISILGNFREIMLLPQLPLVSLIIANMWTEDLPGFDLEIHAKSPSGAGLGGSSCLAVVLISILDQALGLFSKGEVVHLTEKQIIGKAKDLESKIIRAPTGVQDYWGALRGGINIISYPFGGEETKTLEVVDELKEIFSFFAVYSGQSRASSLNNWNIYKGFFEGNSRIVNVLNEIGDLAFETAESLLQGDWNQVFRLSKLEWEARTRMWPDIETSSTQKVTAAAMSGGAQLVRVCGAGGGGVLAVFCEPSKHDSVKASLEKSSCEILQSGMTNRGLEVEILAS